jgi:hypothetical protein
MRKLILALYLNLIFLGVTFAQNWGIFLHPAAETIGSSPFSVSTGAVYKEIKLGVYYQTFHISGTQYVRKGAILEVGLGNVENIAYFAAGMRVLNTNDNFIQVIPHGTVAFRYKYLELPIQVSTFRSNLTASVGIRLLLRLTPDSKVHNPKRVTLRHPTSDRVPGDQRFTLLGAPGQLRYLQCGGRRYQ